MNGLPDRIALVTGGAQGLGQAICLRLAREGCHVAVADIKIEQAEATAELVRRETGRRAIALRMDVTDETSVDEGFAACMAEFGRLDILVSNAGILIAEEVAESDAGKWKAVMMVNLFGYYLTARAATRIMKKQRSGAIIQINSKSGKKGSIRVIQVRGHRIHAEPGAGTGGVWGAGEFSLPGQLA